eukprot:840685-Ditylum_brightwellii.AAC.1
MKKFFDKELHADTNDNHSVPVIPDNNMQEHEEKEHSNENKVVEYCDEVKDITGKPEDKNDVFS